MKTPPSTWSSRHRPGRRVAAASRRGRWANTISPFNWVRAVADPVGVIAGLVAAHRAGVPAPVAATISESFRFVRRWWPQPSGAYAYRSNCIVAAPPLAVPATAAAGRTGRLGWRFVHRPTDWPAHCRTPATGPHPPRPTRQPARAPRTHPAPPKPAGGRQPPCGPEPPASPPAAAPVHLTPGPTHPKPADTPTARPHGLEHAGLSDYKLNPDTSLLLLKPIGYGKSCVAAWMGVSFANMTAPDINKPGWERVNHIPLGHTY